MFDVAQVCSGSAAPEGPEGQQAVSLMAMHADEGQCWMDLTSLPHHCKALPVLG